jgi:hypothetical protein
MDEDLRNQIYNNLRLKETDELVEIWQNNDRVEWSDTAFEVMGEILRHRLDELPPQNEPNYQHVAKEKIDEDQVEVVTDFIDRSNPPIFYKPREVLWMYKWLSRAAIALVIFTIFTYLINDYSALSQRNPDLNLLTRISGLFLTGLSIIIQCSLVYFPLKALALILKILMEMEFNSRGVFNQSTSSTESE